MSTLEPAAAVGVKLPDLIGGGYVDVESAQDVQLVVGYREPTRQDRACGVARPVVAAKEWPGYQ